MFEFLNRLLHKDEAYYVDLKLRLHLMGSVVVPKDIISRRDIYDEGFVYVHELIDGFIEITAHRKCDMQPLSNVVAFKR